MLRPGFPKPWGRRPVPNGETELFVLQWLAQEIRDVRNQSDRRFLFLVALLIGSIVRPFIT